jgi:regulator of extracellular matrix RemA (YlzA/DUF370 family)
MNIGFDNQVPWWRVAAIRSSKGAAAKRERDEAYQSGRLMDATCGRRTRSLVVTDAHQVILSMVVPETLMARLEAARKKGTENGE